MKNIHSLKMVIDMFKVLADNEYSLLWDLVEDFTINGHKVSVKDSTQFKSVIIDDGYYRIGGNTPIKVLRLNRTFQPLEYVEYILSQPKGELEMIDFGNGTKAEIREAIANKIHDSVQRLNEDDTIRIFSPESKEYKRLEAAANLLSLYTGKDYFVNNTYFDYGQDWKWTTIAKESGSLGAVQVLSPKDQKDILQANSATELGKAVDAVLNKKSYIPSNN